MDRILKQFQRIYSDNGSGDVDFTPHEELLRLAKDRLTANTDELARAAENLNRAAMAVGFPRARVH